MERAGWRCENDEPGSRFESLTQICSYPEVTNSKTIEQPILTTAIYQIKSWFSGVANIVILSLTVFPRINAAAFIKFFMIWVRRLFEGGVYLK